MQKGTVGEQRSHANLSVPPLTNAVAGARNYGVGHATALMNAWAHRRCVAVAQSLEISSRGAANGIVARRCRWSNGRLRSAWALTTHAATATGLPSTPCPLGLSVSSRCRSCSPCQDCETGERETGAPHRKSGLSACGGVTARAATCRRAEGYPIVGQPAPPFGNRYP